MQMRCSQFRTAIVLSRGSTFFPSRIMAADKLRFSTEEDPFVTALNTGTHNGTNIASEHLATLSRSVDNAVRRMNEFSDIDTAA